MATSQQRRAEEARFAALIALAKEKAAALAAPKLSITHIADEKEENENETDQTFSIESTENRQFVAETKIVPASPEQPQVKLLSPESRETEQEFIPAAKKVISLNEKQLHARDLALAGKSFCLIGAAGTGKTTAMRIIITAMQQAGLVGPLRSSTKYLTEGKPGVVVLSFTNKAVANIAKGMAKDITCVTAHKLIEFQPVFYEVENADGDLVKTMRFEPNRTKYNPLPSSLSTVCFEESGSISTTLFGQINDPMRHKVQFIFLGDIQQLPPVYGQAILGFKMLELPTIELTEVHRQALDSNILAFAWEIIAGKPLTAAYVAAKYDKEGQFKIRPWKKRLTASNAVHIACLLMKQFIESGEYNYLEDMILIPQNVVKTEEFAFGGIEVNRYIANHLGKQRNAEVHEVIAGWLKYYYAEGDKVFVNKQEAIIEKIVRNGLYNGQEPLASSVHLNRWGLYEYEDKSQREDDQQSLESLEDMLAHTQMDSGQVEDKKNQASHILKCRYLDSDEIVEVNTTGEYADTSFAYVLTIHKAQGSEWKRVILLIHHTHAKMISRELLYTAVTRARESLYIICEPETFVKGILRQRIKGNTLAEKAEFFKGKLEELKQIAASEEDDE